MDINTIDKKRIAIKLASLIEADFKDVDNEYLYIRIIGTVSEALMRFESSSFCAEGPDALDALCMDAMGDEDFRSEYLEHVYGTFEESIAEAVYYLIAIQKFSSSKLKDSSADEINHFSVMMVGGVIGRKRNYKVLMDDISRILYDVIFVFVSGIRFVGIDTCINAVVARLETIANIAGFKLQDFVEWYIRFKGIEYGEAK